MTSLLTTSSHLLDPKSQTVLDQLHQLATRQRKKIIRHYLPRLPAYLLGRPIHGFGDMNFFDDKLIPVDPEQGALLYLLARTSGAQQVVEFGTSYGVSTIYLAAGVRDANVGGRVIGTELVPTKVEAASEHVRLAGLADIVEIRPGDAMETLRDLASPIDLLLLDGWPGLAMKLLLMLEPKLADNAIIVVDNIAQFRHELGPALAHLSASPYRSSRLFNGSTLVAVAGRAFR